jgi:hypothetical protein
MRLRFPRLLDAPDLVRRELEVRAAEVGVTGDEARLRRLFELAAGSHLMTMPCLPRSLALHRFLRRHGHPSQVRVGMRRESGGLRGHAWVERRGTPLESPTIIRSFVRFEVAR